MRKEKLSRAAAADRLVLTPQQVSNLVRDGMPSEKKGAGYVVVFPDAMAWYKARLREEGARKAAPSTLDEARLRRETADAELKELELAERRGELVTVEVHAKLLNDAFARAGSKLKNLARAIALRVTGATIPEREAQALPLVNEVARELAAGEDVPADETEEEAA